MEAIQNKCQADQLKGFARLIWWLFGNRKYACNTFSISEEQGWFMHGGFLLVVGFTGWAFMPLFQFPFLYMSVIFSFICAFCLIRLANVIVMLPAAVVIFTILALHFHWHWGFTFLHYHMEQYVCYVFFVGGGLSLLRRGWNAVVWFLLRYVSA